MTMIRSPWLLVPLLIVTVLAAPAAADLCTGCAEPTVAEILQKTGATLEERDVGFGDPVRDYMEMDAGDCNESARPDEVARLVSSHIYFRAMGEVWNCPDSASSSTVRAQITHQDRTDWSASSGGNGKIKAPFVEFGLSHVRSNGGARGIVETTDLSQTITAKECQRIPWIAALRVGTFELDVMVSSTQTYAWWTKNTLSDEKVHQKGEYMQPCAAAQVVLERRAPMVWHVRRSQLACSGCTGGAPKDLGWAPPMPPGTPPVPLPPGVWWPDDEAKAKEDDEPAGLHPDLDPDWHPY